MTDRGNENAPAGADHAVLLTQSVADLDRWKAGWDASETQRRDAGFLGHLIHRSQNDPAVVTVLLAAAGPLETRALAPSFDRTRRVQRWGVLDQPDVRCFELLRSALIWDRRLPAAIVTARVVDVDAWLAADDVAAHPRTTAGIVGHLVARAIDDPHLVVVVDQAERFGALRSFLAATAMADDVTVSPPDVHFQTSGWGKTY